MAPMVLGFNQGSLFLVGKQDKKGVASVTTTDPYTYKDTDIVIRKPAGLKVLYFCPATMLENVKREFNQWAPHRQVVILGAQPKATRRFLLSVMAEAPEYVVVANYEMWRRDKGLIDDIIDIEFDTCIIDEAHNIKDRDSIAYKGIKRIITESHGGKGIPFVIPMTGTPILNKPQELFSLLTLVDPYHFHTEYYFLQDFCQQDYDGKWGFKPGGMDRLSKQISNYFLRRTKEDAGIVLPPKTVTVHEIEVDEEAYPGQASARRQMRTWGSIMLDPEQGKAITAAAAIAVYTRLRQIETWPAGIQVKDPRTKEVMMQVDVYESQKLDYIIKNREDGILPEIVGDERVVIFSQFKEPLRELKRRCDAAGIKAVILDGDTSDEIRNQIALDFDNRYTADRANSRWDVVLCNYRVGGIGLNFTAATQMIVVDEEWNPGKRDQAYDRIHRMGQDKPVTIHVLRDWYKPEDQPQVKGGIDVWLSGIIARKEEIVDEFNEAADLASDGFNALKSGLI